MGMLLSMEIMTILQASVHFAKWGYVFHYIVLDDSYASHTA